MPTLNCGSAETTYDSLSIMFGASVQRIRKTLLEIDLEAECGRSDFDGDPNHALWDRLISQLGSWQPATEVYWFHLSRALPGTTFSNGLLPLTTALQEVWLTFEKVFAGSPHEPRLRSMRKGGVQNFQYQHKVGKPYLAGPFAMLVRESAFRSREMGNHDYLRVPEIVEDICLGYREQFGEDILGQIESALVPCIVCFRSARFRDVHVQSAARYLYDLEHNETLTMWSNHIFDGRNRSVPFGDIVSVEFL